MIIMIIMITIKIFIPWQLTNIWLVRSPSLASYLWPCWPGWYWRYCQSGWRPRWWSSRLGREVGRGRRSTLAGDHLIIIISYQIVRCQIVQVSNCPRYQIVLVSKCPRTMMLAREYGVSPYHVTFVTWPECRKGAKDKVKKHEGPPARSRARDRAGGQRAPRLLVSYNNYHNYALHRSKG